MDVIFLVSMIAGATAVSLIGLTLLILLAIIGFRFQQDELYPARSEEKMSGLGSARDN